MHGIHFIQLLSITKCCRESTAFNRYPLQHAAWIPLHETWIHCPTLHAIHCIHSGCISHCSMESSALNHTAWNPLHSIGISYTKLHRIHFIPSRYIAPLCIESTAFNHAAWNPLHSIGLHGPHCIGSTAFTQYPYHNAALTPLH